MSGFNEVHAPTTHDVSTKTLTLIADGRYREAFDSLNATGRSPLRSQMMAVCAMRFGDVDFALNLLRGLCLTPGTTIIRSDTSDTLRINFATALLLKGLPSGTLEILQDVRDRQSSPVCQLKDAIRRWEKSLSWLRWLDWKTSRIEPARTVVPIDFDPGVFPIGLPVRRDTGAVTDPSGRPNPTTPQQAA